MNTSDVIEGYRSIQTDLFDVFASKLSQYGNGMYHGHSRAFNFWAAYFNVRRKALRLERLTKLALAGDGEACSKLISDYKDLANYSIMAIQILEEQR